MAIPKVNTFLKFDESQKILFYCKILISENFSISKKLSSLDFNDFEGSNDSVRSIIRVLER